LEIGPAAFVVPMVGTPLPTSFLWVPSYPGSLLPTNLFFHSITSAGMMVLGRKHPPVSSHDFFEERRPRGAYGHRSDSLTPTPPRPGCLSPHGALPHDMNSSRASWPARELSSTRRSLATVFPHSLWPSSPAFSTLFSPLSLPPERAPPSSGPGHSTSTCVSTLTILFGVSSAFDSPSSSRD